MKSILSSALLAVFIVTCMVSCNTATPEKYFDEAVLNTNMLTDFAQSWSFREMESPSVVMNEKGEEVSQKRQDGLQAKIDFLDKAFEKITGLKETSATKEMLQASKAVYAHTLPVYKNEYMQLAKMYDGGADKEKIEELRKMITDKYATKFASLFDKLMATGKVYANKNNIKVNWGDEKK